MEVDTTRNTKKKNSSSTHICLVCLGLYEAACYCKVYLALTANQSTSWCLIRKEGSRFKMSGLDLKG